MIAELFYPKELKEIITDLRADDNLNTDALKNVNREILRQRSTMFAMIIISLCIFIYLFPEPTAYIGLFCAFSFFLISFFMFNTYIIPYANGIVTKGIIKTAHYDIIPTQAGYRGWSVTYEFFDSKGHAYEGRTFSIKKEDVKNKKLKEGDELEIFYLKYNPSKNAVFLPSIYKKLCLRKKPRG